MQVAFIFMAFSLCPKRRLPWNRVKNSCNPCSSSNAGSSSLWGSQGWNSSMQGGLHLLVMILFFYLNVMLGGEPLLSSRQESCRSCCCLILSMLCYLGGEPFLPRHSGWTCDQHATKFCLHSGSHCDQCGNIFDDKHTLKWHVANERVNNFDFFQHENLTLALTSAQSIG